MRKVCVLKKTDTVQKAYGNFYMQPNGIFYITKKGKAVVTTTTKFMHQKPVDINYATQSGSMLVINGKIHHRFMPGSKNAYIRNGVGILSNGKLLFAISKEKINFYDFASFFKQKGGVKMHSTWMVLSHVYTFLKRVSLKTMVYLV